MEDRALLGSCLCGSVRYEIAASLENAEHCHCSMCRKAHGAAFSTNSVVPTDTLTVTSGADLISEYESSPKRRKCFCPPLNWRGSGSSEHKRYERGCGVNMHQLSNLTHWFRLRAIWRIGGKPLQRVDECAVRYHDQGGLQRKI